MINTMEESSSEEEEEKEEDIIAVSTSLEPSCGENRGYILIDNPDLSENWRMTLGFNVSERTV